MNDDKSVVLQFLRKNWFGVFGIIFGTLVSYYFYTLSVKEKNLSVLIDGMAIPIVNSSLISAGKFSILDNNGEIIEGDISATRIIITNRGNLPILEEDIKAPLLVNFTEKGTKKPINIINILLFPSGKENIINPSITTSKSGFNYKFELLEPDDEISLVIIFSGLENPDYSVPGHILGVPRIEVGPYLPRGFRRNTLVTIFIILFGMITIKLINKDKIQLDRKIKEHTIPIIEIIMVVTFFSFAATALF